MRTYPLTQQGVDDFLHDLYSSSIRVQIDEQERIIISLADWLAYRFGLSDEQLAYVDALDEDFMNDLGQQIVYAINYQIAIVLDKQTDAARTAQLDGDSVKVTAYEASQKREGSVEEEPPNPDHANETKRNPDNRDRRSKEATLIIRIFYRSS